MSEVQQKLKALIETHERYAKEDGSTRISTCNYAFWDKDIWYNRQSIINEFKNRGYEVSTSTNHGVLDIDITLKLDLSK